MAYFQFGLEIPYLTQVVHFICEPKNIQNQENDQLLQET